MTGIRLTIQEQDGEPAPLESGAPAESIQRVKVAVFTIPLELCKVPALRRNLGPLVNRVFRDKKISERIRTYAEPGRAAVSDEGNFGVL